MDAIDLRILDALQANGRATQADIAKALGVSPPTVGERIRKLETNGVIRGYACLLDPERVSRPITAFVAIRLDKPLHTKAFLQRIQELDDVLECYHATGDMDYLLKVRTRSTRTLEALLNNDLRTLDGVATTRTSIVLSAAKEETRMKLALEDLKGRRTGT
jgi:Lrp/AsnC family leucine-responsive transcriptional regulator